MAHKKSGAFACPCGSDKNYVVCCQPLHLKKDKAKTPEQLMRSRYSAYALGDLGQYLVDTWHPDYLGGLSAEALNHRGSNWIGLNVVQQSVSTKGNEGVVEFVAAFEDIECPSPRQFLRERSDFSRIDGVWLYTQGDMKAVTYPKRNDACLCGSGIKFKKCCAKFL